MASRRVSLVSTKSERKAVVQWMLAKVEKNGSDSTIAAHAVEQFPDIFRQTSRRTNREKGPTMVEDKKRFSFCYRNCVE